MPDTAGQLRAGRARFPAGEARIARALNAMWDGAVAFDDLLCEFGAGWELGQTATGRWWAVQRAGAGERPVAVWGETPAGLGLVLQGRAGAGGGVR